MNRELIQKATNFGGFLLSRVPKSRFSVHKNPTDLVGSSNRFGWFIQPIWLVHPTDLVGFVALKRFTDAGFRFPKSIKDILKNIKDKKREPK